MADDKKEKKATPSKKEPKKQIKKEVVEEIPGVDPAIAKVIKDALLIHVNQLKNDRRKQQIDELNAMVSTCQEFMQSFVILGYDLNGQPIIPIIHAHNQQEADALGNYLSKFIKSQIQDEPQRPPGEFGDSY